MDKWGFAWACVSVYSVCVCCNGYVHTEIRIGCQVSSFSLFHPSYYLEVGSPNLFGYLGWPASSLHLPFSVPSCWDYRYTQPCVAFTWVLGIQSSHLQSKHSYWPSHHHSTWASFYFSCPLQLRLCWKWRCDRGHNLVVEQFPSLCRALGLIPSSSRKWSIGRVGLYHLHSRQSTAQISKTMSNWTLFGEAL